MMDFTIGGVIRETLRIAKLKFLVCFALALALVELPKWGGPFLLASALADLQRSMAGGDLSPTAAFLRAFALGSVPGLVAQAGGVLLTGFVVGLALDAAAGRASHSASTLRAALAAWPGNLVLTLIYSLGVVLGSVLLVVPGLILACMWVVYLPAHMAEGGPLLSCLGRSRELTKGYRWRIFWLTLIYGFLVGVVLGFLSGFATGLASSSVGSGLAVVVRVLVALLGAALAVVSSSGVAAIYLGLRGVKEGVMPVSVAEAFS